MQETQEKRKERKNKTLENNIENKNVKNRLSYCTEKGITLIALVVTTIFSYDENIKSSNNKGFLLQSI